VQAARLSASSGKANFVFMAEQTSESSYRFRQLALT